MHFYSHLRHYPCLKAAVCRFRSEKFIHDKEAVCVQPYCISMKLYLVENAGREGLYRVFPERTRILRALTR